MFKGSMVAIVTPFKNGKVDEKALGDLIEFQIKNGTDVIVPCGTTGESATLSHEEHHRVVEFTVQDREQARPGGCRRGLELDLRDRGAHEVRAEGGRQRRAAHHALLQQAHAGRPVPAFQEGGRDGGYPDHPVQRAGQDEREHAAEPPWRGCGRSRTSSASRRPRAI